MDRVPVSEPYEAGAPTVGSTLAVRGLSVELDGRRLLSIADVDLRPGVRALVTAEHGDSLTCLAHVLSGLVPSPWRRAVGGHTWSRDLTQFEAHVLSGHVRFDRLQLIARTLLVPEDLDTWFVAGSGYDELAFCGWVEGHDPRLDLTLSSLIDMGLLARPIYCLSGGEKQRLALAISLVMRPDCLILLNAFGWLDQAHRARVLDALLELPTAIVFCDDHLDLLKGACSEHWHIDGTGALTRAPDSGPGGASRTRMARHRLHVTRTERPVARSTFAVEGHGLGFQHVGFDDVDVVSDATFTIPRVSDVYLVGANGSGKSTLATLICGLEPRYSGTLSVWDGQTGAAAPARLRATRGASAPQLLFQFVDDNLIRWTVGDYLSVGTSRHQVADRQDVLDWLEDTGVSVETRVHVMDTCQKKLAVLARMAVTDCRLAFFDEPTWGLTSVEQERLLAFVDRFLGGLVRIWITHETEYVPYQPEAIVRIVDGRISVET